MKRKLILATFAVVGMAMVTLMFLQGTAWAQVESPLTVSNGVHKAHVFPTVLRKPELISPQDFGPLLYNGGRVMDGSVVFYGIFWIPAHLQNGGATMMPARYQAYQTALLHDYPEHSLGNNNTQYYEKVSGVTSYIRNRPGGYYTYVDTNPYPASGCTDTVTPGNCITDAQIQAEIQRVMTLNGWTGGLNKLFLLYTSSGEGSCFDSSGSSCSYTQYCGYHSFINGSTPIVYANEPWGDPNYCQVPGTPSPNNDIPTDTAATVASHEISEAMTDPLLNAWYTAQGNEIGDLCAYNYGTNLWDNGNANEMWYGRFWELQQEFDNLTNGCVQVGP